MSTEKPQVMPSLWRMIHKICIRYRKYRIFLNPLDLARHMSPRGLTPLAVLVASSIGAAGCAGPSTPLGAVWAVHPSQVNAPRLSTIASIFEKTVIALGQGSPQPTVTFYPGRQVLHAPSPITVVIHEPAGVPFVATEDLLKNLSVRHNGYDVTASFLMQAKTKVGKNRIFIRVPVLRLQPSRDHQIEVIYGTARRHAYARLEPPRCDARADRGIHSTQEFKPNPALMQQITAGARERHFSPAFAAALIAQESGFEAKRVSWAKAVGLTQVTGVAEVELDEKLPEFKTYPRFPGLNAMPYMWVQALIATGQVNAHNEWRLDNGRSIRGGLAYLDILAMRWQTPENRARVLRVFGEAEFADAMTRLILASYNSGYSRVWSALSRLEYSWQLSPDLKEAKKYVGRIFSYCDHFSEPETAVTAEEIPELYHENET